MCIIRVSIVNLRLAFKFDTYKIRATCKPVLNITWAYCSEISFRLEILNYQNGISYVINSKFLRKDSKNNGYFMSSQSKPKNKKLK